MTQTALVDTSALLALANPRDGHHAEAVHAARKYREKGGRFLGTVMVLGEFHAHLLYLAGPVRARRVTFDLVEDVIYSWLNVDIEIVSAATSGWLERFPDQKFSLIDAVSFEIMRRNRLSIAFAYDRHFRIAGFELLQ